MRQEHNSGLNKSPAPSVVPLRHDNSKTIALIQEWMCEDATDDPAKIAEAEREVADFKAALNASRPPDRPIFP